MELTNLPETRARKFRLASVVFLVVATVSLFSVFVGLYYSSPLVAMVSLLVAGVFLFSAFMAGGIGLSVVAKQGAKVVYREKSTLLEHSEQQEGLRLDTEPPYMTDFPEEDHPPERGR